MSNADAIGLADACAIDTAEASTRTYFTIIIPKKREIVKCAMIIDDMYSGTTFRRSSGNRLGAHQKIDRVARRYVTLLKRRGDYFPSISEILHFEGNNGPDGIKRKSPSIDEPWHYVDPSDPDDRAIYALVRDHYDNLVSALGSKNHQRAAFEAAWLAHAIVDGLTPAHHYPLGEKIEELWGKPHDQRLSIREKNIIIGETRRETVSKNWQYWGAKGVFSTHVMFELGVATTIKPLRFAESQPTHEDVAEMRRRGIEECLSEAIARVYALDMYHTFWAHGWTAKLARQTKRHLAPIIIRTVALAWAAAIEEARS